MEYWIVNGAACSGKSTVSKFICAEYGYKMIEFGPYMETAKEKLLGPDDGEEVPLKKILAHFASMIKDDCKSVYLFDGIPYEGKDLEAWIETVGAPCVINLKVEDNELIMRNRKKNEGDLKAEVTEEDTTRTKETVGKNNDWINKLHECSPLSLIHI